MRILMWLGLALAVVLADQLSKFWILAHYPEAGFSEVLPWLNIGRWHNTGAAFSFLADAGGWQNWLFSGFASVVSVGLAVWLWLQPQGQYFTCCSISLVLGGALGNLFDRLCHGYVVDFIDIHLGTWHWPAFNVADSAICVGALLLVIHLLCQGSKNSP